MPRYFFDVYDGTALPDRRGVELADKQEAQKRAGELAAELLRNIPDRIWSASNWSVWVRNEAGEKLCSILIAGILAPAGRDDATS